MFSSHTRNVAVTSHVTWDNHIKCDLGQSCQVNAATAASSSLIGSLRPEIEFDGELNMQINWIINQFNDHMADSTRFCQTCSQIP